VLTVRATRRGAGTCSPAAWSGRRPASGQAGRRFDDAVRPEIRAVKWGKSALSQGGMLGASARAGLITGVPLTIDPFIPTIVFR
jgi:hypothetical protein